MTIKKLRANGRIYEVGKGGVRDIGWDRDMGLVTVVYDIKSEWDTKIISIQGVGSIDIKQ
jgi:hypothetical protein